MSPRTPKFGGMASRLVWLALLGCVVVSHAQESANERSFPQSKAVIEKTLRDLQSTSGRLPVLEGFANPSTHPLDHYQRGYYQSKFQVSAAPSGGSVVRVIVEVTAFYVDPSGAKSGYQLLPSNGRIEADLLDQLSDQLAAGGTGVGRPVPATDAGISPAPTALPKRPAQASSSTATAASPTASNEPSLSAPVPRLPEVRSGLSSSLAASLEEQEKARAKPGAKKLDDPGPLEAELNSLEEVLKNQAHPKNLVAVKNSGTPVVSSASLNARTLFLATAHDEFEMLDFNQDWVHVKISGLSRGWIWRNNLEMPDSVPEGDAPATAGGATAAAFHVSREEVAPFPGDWEPLRNKSVKIVSVEQTDEKAKDLDPKLRLEFAKSVMDKDYAELAGKPQEMQGIVLIFDSADGGMIAATFSTLQKWKAGSISDAALWHQCYFDPPETFIPAPTTAAAASR
ncbi:MAG: hypothetical protein WCC95_07730 [Candidatus Sulfotelmatobacter sp.]